MLPTLIDSARAQQNSALAALYAGSPAHFTSLLEVVSDAVRKHCMRDFSLATYSEYYNGGIYVREPLKLRQFPVTEISRIGTAQRCMLIQNAGETVQRATVETLNDGVGSFKITTVANGVATTTTLSGSTYPTVEQMANAIIGLGAGWGVTIYSGPAGAYNNFAVTDLKPLQGAASALVGGCFVDIYEDWYGWNSAAFWPDENYELGAVAPFWRLDNETGEVWGHLPRGFMNLRIDYTAGFTTVPQAVQEACVELMQWMAQRSQANLAYSSARLGAASVTLSESAKWPISVLNSLSYYRAFDRQIDR